MRQALLLTMDLVAIWRSRQGMRFQNYRATYTVLDIAKVDRAWIDDVLGPGTHYQATARSLGGGGSLAAATWP